MVRSAFFHRDLIGWMWAYCGLYFEKSEMQIAMDFNRNGGSNDNHWKTLYECIRILLFFII